MELNLKITPKQQKFINASEDEVLFGGAAGGGKSYGQLVDALLYACKYAGSKQLILRRTYQELELSLIRTSLTLYPQGAASYNDSKKKWLFGNGSIVDFGYCDAEKDVYRYQSAEYDVIRFDELTHFTSTMYTYLMSRCRGANNFPKQIKSTTNPGGVGHKWVKERFIDPAPAETIITLESGTRVFIPSFLRDNIFLTQSDPEYAKRLDNLSENDRKALRDGCWDIFEGQYFDEFDQTLHVIKPIPLPEYWLRFFCMDYGLDMLAAYWIAMDEAGNAYVYKEAYESGLIVSDAAKLIKELTTEKVYAYLAPPDLWNRHSDTGKSTAEIFAESGIDLIPAKNDRVQGWMEVKEWLKPRLNEHGELKPKLRIFENCRDLIRCLPAMIHDKKNYNDCAKEPHEYTHAPDAIRYFCAGRPFESSTPTAPEERDTVSIDVQIDDFMNFGGDTWI